MSKYNDTPNWRRQTRTPPEKPAHIVDMNGLVKIPYQEKTKKTEQSHRKDAVIRVGGGIFCLGCSIPAMWLFLYVSLHVDGFVGFPQLLLAASLIGYSFVFSFRGEEDMSATYWNYISLILTLTCATVVVITIIEPVVNWFACKQCFCTLPNGGTEVFYSYLAACCCLYLFVFCIALWAILAQKEKNEEENQEENEQTVYLCHCKECGYMGRISFWRNCSYNSALGKNIWNCPKCNWCIERSEIVHCFKEYEERGMDKIKIGGAKWPLSM